ncbi:Secretory pathway Sec39 [Niveomyces insectorum RCEF 264]|uniref:Secretory pathway Sec39 n=1 Tax=Niveomyces insectorum RCEF 264 TaxID=1081102 RepID=A0A167X523_9HYPO|nr:Secretory pathway Sec39 [Niveomyces insectorum RCEF 264]
MSLALSPPKVVLLAAHFIATSSIASLASLAAQNADVLRTKLLLRLLLTYLPTHLKTELYLPFLESLDAEDFSRFFPLQELDCSSVEPLSDEQAAKKLRKLHVRRLSLSAGNTFSSGSSGDGNAAEQDPHEDEAEEDKDPLVSFLILRAYAVDDGAGALPELPALVYPFLDRSARLRTWTTSTLLPLLRRNCEYYPDSPLQHTLAEFEQLPDRIAVAGLLSRTGVREDQLACVGRDLRGLVGPWIYNERRWTSRAAGKDKTAVAAAAALAVQKRDDDANGSGGYTPPPSLCPGWEEVLQWLTAQASTTWKVAVTAVEQWDGPSDADFGGCSTMWLDDDEQEYLERRYARAALACAYLIPEASVDAMTGAYGMVGKIMTLLDQDPVPALQTAVSLLPPVPAAVRRRGGLLSPQHATYLRNDLLDTANPLTAPSPAATELLCALILSAAVLQRLGSPCTIRRAGELALLQSEHEQVAEATKVIHWVASAGPKGEDKFWIKARNEILWLRDWGADEESTSEAASKPQAGNGNGTGNGVFGRVQREYIETELLKALLAHSRYALACALYEDSPDHPLPKKTVQDTVLAAALNAYDNASNPNRTRGGLKKCDDIIHSFPKTMQDASHATQKVEALLAATHALSDYRLVLRQGEPFTPVVLRVHQDPLSIFVKVLEQNPKSYTKLHELVRLAMHMVDAGLAVRDNKAGVSRPRPSPTPAEERSLAERRVTAMCIEAALNEDDFETAYSYVVGRLSTLASDAAAAAAAADADAGPPCDPAKVEGAARLLAGPTAATTTTRTPTTTTADAWSWRAALAAGKYRRTEQTVRPTHVGTASANLDIRHLEQRIECLATALRIAPSDALQEILNVYRRCEEELDVAVQAEDEQEHAWDDAADWQRQTPKPQSRQTRHQRGMPGGFADSSTAAGHNATTTTTLASRMAAAATAAGGAGAAPRYHHQQEQSALPVPPPADDAPLSLFDLSRATARAAQRNLSALSSLRQTRQLVGLGGENHGSSGGGGDGVGDDDEEGEALAAAAAARNGRAGGANNAPAVRKRDQLREAAMGTLTSGVGWLIGAQPLDRSASSGSN